MNTVMNFIRQYIQVDATATEINDIKQLIESRTVKIDPHLVLEKLVDSSRKLFTGSNKLEVVKHVKDITGWGLKEAKDWSDAVIFPKTEHHF